MACFLSPKRRDHLIEALTALSMPPSQAAQLSSQSEDLVRLDRWLSQILTHVPTYAYEIRRAVELRNEARRLQFDRYLDAICTIYQVYKAEIEVRKLDAQTFPLITRQIAVALRSIETHKAMVEKHMQGGHVQ
jgi:hypothetical protein